MRLDREDLRDVVHDYLASCLGPIRCFEGHVAQTTGDGVVAYFWYPNAHEDDAHRAVRAGLEIVRDIQRLNQTTKLFKEVAISARVGLHTGLAVTDTVDGIADRTKIAVVGATLNVPARPAGCILKS
jgi:class 3 adenylate cyclase